MWCVKQSGINGEREREKERGGGRERERERRREREKERQGARRADEYFKTGGKRLIFKVRKQTIKGVEKCNLAATLECTIIQKPKVPEADIVNPSANLTTVSVSWHGKRLTKQVESITGRCREMPPTHSNRPEGLVHLESLSVRLGYGAEVTSSESSGESCH